METNIQQILKKLVYIAAAILTLSACNTVDRFFVTYNELMAGTTLRF